MKRQLIECVPNFSEGRNKDKIRQITDSITKIKGVKLLNVDPGKATNRTVVTFIGDPESVIEAAFRGIKKAGEIIDIPTIFSAVFSAEIQTRRARYVAQTGRRSSFR